MGQDREAVVDAELRVRGVDGLRIADASVMPTIPAANTNAASIMIGEFVSRLLTRLELGRNNPSRPVYPCQVY
jgi:choline dehydrogenase